MRLYLARHAQTQSNVDCALDTARPGAPLNETGREQAERLAERLAAEPCAVVAASPLLRARQTAEPLAAARSLPVHTVGGLREIDAGDLEMRTSAEAGERYVAAARAWGHGDLDVALPGGISGHEFLRRFDEAVAAIEALSATESAVAVSHGAAIRTWAAIRCRDAAISRHKLANTDVLVLEGSSRAGWVLDRRLETGAGAMIRSEAEIF